MKKVLVTGAGGFAGGHIAQYLQDCGIDVVGIVYQKKPICHFPIETCDLAKELQVEGEFEAIVHAAGGLPYNTIAFQDFKRNNVDVMENVLRFAAKKKIHKIIYLSTIGIYGEFRDSLIKETADRINQDYYGLTKYMAECMLRETTEVKGISLRMPGIIGKGSRGVWFTNTVEKLRQGQEIKIYSPDFQTKNFVWIDDLSRFVETLLQSDEWQYDAVNLACSESASIREIVFEMKRLLGSSSNIIIEDGERPPFCLDDKRAVEMGYTSLSPLDIVKKYISLE